LTKPGPSLLSGPLPRRCLVLHGEPAAGEKGGSMRAWSIGAALTLALTVPSPASAQTAKGFGGVNPSVIVNQPLATTDTSSSIASIPLFDHSIHLKDFMPSVG